MKITFFRSATNLRNDPYKSPLMSITIPNDVPEEQAIADAIKEFEKKMKINHWQDLAELYEIT